MRGYDVCAAVVSDLQYDARVWKEARSLAAAGYSVKLIGCRYETRQPRRWRSAEGVDVVEVPLGTRSHSSVRARIAAMILLWSEVLRTRARVYHTHNIHPGPATLFASRLRDAWLVYDAHEIYGDEAEQMGMPAGAGFTRLARLLERLLVGRSNVVITTNPSRAEILRNRHGRPEVGVLANVPLRVDEVEPLDPGFPADVPVLLYQGGVYPERPLDEVVRALPLLARERVHLVVIGFGRAEALAAVRDAARAAGVLDRVVLLGPRPFEELVRTAAAATVGVVPLRGESLNEFLGDTNKLHEYLMAGLPVVASDLPEIRRVVCEGQPCVGELFDPSDPVSIAEAVRRVLDSDTYHARRHEARRLALERFNWEIEEQKLLQWYHSLIGDGGDGS